jgi:hypothetical protein
VVSASLGDQISQAASLLGLLLALDTIFTAEQARRLADERTRVGGARTARVRAIRFTAAGLTLVTVSAIAALFPLVLDVVESIGSPEWQPVFAVFQLTWILLIALAAWQLFVAWRAS